MANSCKHTHAHAHTLVHWFYFSVTHTRARERARKRTGFVSAFFATEQVASRESSSQILLGNIRSCHCPELFTHFEKDFFDAFPSFDSVVLVQSGSELPVRFE